MPETTMNEYRFPPGRKDDVRISRQVSPMQAIAVAHTVQQAADDHFRLRVDTADTAHKLAALLWI